MSGNYLFFKVTNIAGGLYHWCFPGSFKKTFQKKLVYSTPVDGCLWVSDNDNNNNTNNNNNNNNNIFGYSR